MKTWLIDLRKSKGLTQEELAKIVGISQNSISRFETGESIPKPVIAKKIAKILCFEWWKLYEDND